MPIYLPIFYNFILKFWRYNVERNPVEVGMIVKAEDYHWSSAAAHCGLNDNFIDKFELITKRTLRYKP
jgi:hypothetical protein